MNVKVMKVNDIQLSECTYTRVEGNIRKVWDVPVLVQFVKEKKYKTFDLPIEGIDMSNLMWCIRNTIDFIKHYRRCNKADLKYPILIDDMGTICDGWHRVVKATIEGKKYIKAIRLDEIPEASCEEKL
jgi:hypothetical protein